MKRSNIFGIIASLAIILLFGIWGYKFYQTVAQNTLPGQTIVIKEEREYPFYRPIDGRGVATEFEIRQRPIAVIIDNSSDARPAVGIEHASLVYETIAEGSITRQLAIFDPLDLPKKIGPVRSLRPYYLSWANEVDATTVHVGGSPEALAQVTKKDNINEFFAGQFFWRDNKRSAPHNTFTSRDLLFDAIELFKYATSTNFLKWSYSTSTRDFAIKADSVTIDFSIDQYKVTWEYDEDLKRYTRKVNGNKERATAKNIIIQAVDARVLDAELRRELTLTGTGRAWIVRDGAVTIGNWIKGSIDKRTAFIDDEGNDILLSPGTTWVEVIDDEGRVSF